MLRRGYIADEGIIAMEHSEQRFAIQGMHMLNEGGPQRPWKRRESRLVFIGRDLPRNVRKQDFEACSS